MATSSYILSVLLFLSLSGVVLSETCAYSISIKTGSRNDAGTDAKISLKFSDMEDSAINISNLEKYGVMEGGHDYSENDQLDLFTYTGPCFTNPVCYIKLSHDNSGNKPGWYVKYVEITTSSNSAAPIRKHFDVNQWLALDEPPFQISTSRDMCAT
ncbi:PLAT domain-containing protein 2-like [Mercurialis annua]|uniref:PLAT domain-containing protein 2-like n=1 Tax=Mercurialis annua TaxID=3986 RepID=UPI00215FB1A9|nr:PLAT domain-containing protein 2-like [Mercurialis annua]